MWVCGLKHFVRHPRNPQALSHPMWVCGLKHSVLRGINSPRRVTPYVGVWIETLRVISVKLSVVSHPMWVCGLKQDSEGRA